MLWAPFDFRVVSPHEISMYNLGHFSGGVGQWPISVPVIFLLFGVRLLQYSVRKIFTLVCTTNYYNMWTTQGTVWDDEVDLKINVRTST